jgi:CspA family cold shock protein
MRGTVKFFSDERGYGFIKLTDGGDDEVFVHIRSLGRCGLNTLADGQQVEFDVVPSRSRIREGKVEAANIRVVES